MANTNERFAPDELEDRTPAANAVPGDPASDIKPPEDAATLTINDEKMVDDALNRVHGLIAEEVAKRISDDDVSLRLRHVLDQVADWSDDPRNQMDDLTLYGYRIVETWIRLAMALDRGDIGLADEDVDEIVTDTVALATNSFCADRAPAGVAERQATFLGFCAESIPQAYRSWRLRTAFGELQQVELVAEGGEALVELLRRAVAGRTPPAIAVLRSWGRTDGEIEEVLMVTTQVLATFI